MKTFIEDKKILIILIGVGIVIGSISILGIKNIKGESGSSVLSFKDTRLATIQGNSLLPVSNPSLPLKAVQKIKMVITAYSSTPQQTDSTPFITASGSWVKNGVVANNLLPFGTKIRIPEIYGDRIFIVEDRMNRRKGYYHLDIWFSDYWQAKHFGAQKAYIEILEN